MSEYFKAFGLTMVNSMNHLVLKFYHDFLVLMIPNSPLFFSTYDI